MSPWETHTAKMVVIADEYLVEKEEAREKGMPHNITVAKIAKRHSIPTWKLRDFLTRMPNRKTPMPDPDYGC